jgi:predicted DNA-binding protein (UPF0251 family)
MPRPIKCRRVAFLPHVKYFKPAGIPFRALQEVRLSVEEAEAVRLKELENLEQEQGAACMNISRPTFQRILASARQKMADALLNGKAIRIDGGSFEIAFSRFRCRHGHEWDVPFEVMMEQALRLCPECHTVAGEPVQPAGLGRTGIRRHGRQERDGTQYSPGMRSDGDIDEDN